MTVSVGCGPLERIDGPLPVAPLFGLLQAAQAPAAGVQVVPDADARGVERWMNGATVFPYPPSTGGTWDPNSTGTDRVKSDGDEVAPEDLPEFGPHVAYLAETCFARKVWDQQEYRQRAVAAFQAVESSIVAGEFMRGTALPGQPHLADGNGDFPNGDAVTSFPDGVAFLEEAIAATGRQGIIHCSPQLLAAAAARYGWNYWHDARNQVVRMITGTVIIPDAGYGAGSTPTGHQAPAVGEEWMYATGPIDVRRSDVFLLPDRVEQALDRGTPHAASNGRANQFTYRVERYYMVDWDTQLQAAVLVDRCTDDCNRGT